MGGVRYAQGVALDGDVSAVAERVDARLTSSAWDLAALEDAEPEVCAAAEVAVFALQLAGKRRQARRGGRFGRLIASFALAACLALTACDKPNASPEATQVAISELPQAAGSSATITAQPRASPAPATKSSPLTPRGTGCNCLSSSSNCKSPSGWPMGLP